MLAELPPIANRGERYMLTSELNSPKRKSRNWAKKIVNRSNHRIDYLLV
jgi:hypothetical protein